MGYVRNIVIFFISICFCLSCSNKNDFDGYSSERVKIPLNTDWKFALGHTYDRTKDFNNGTSYFSYVTKAGFGDGPAAKDFDDRMWRAVSVPHDWCVELPFSENGSVSHGSKTIGRNYPENSVGWYRKTFFIDSADFGKKISIEFEGVFRDSKVWCNGFYLGNEPSGYTGFSYDLTEYLNYGGENVIAVRADASFEEGWFYEGAGIYRNVNLIKTNPLHVARYGTFITTDKLFDSKAEITSRTKIVNESNEPATFVVIEKIINPDEAYKNTDSIAFGSDCQIEKQSKKIHLAPHSSTEVVQHYSISNPLLWNVWDEGFPYLYRSDVCVYNTETEKVVDTYQTNFGIRTVAFDADNGLFINGKSIKVRGVCLHQDHAGVGVAITPDLQNYRVRKMMDMGCNAIRTSHNPPAPDFLNTCDRLGVLVMDELRLMGINQEHKKNIEQLILRDRNHPSVFIWSLGNEEWAIEGNEKGARIAQNMEQYAHLLDSSRAFTIAASGGWENGIGKTTEVCGINYIDHGDVDGFHAKYPDHPLIGTEESNTIRTRGVYTTNDTLCMLAATNLYDEGMRGGWQFYNERPWASGLFYWTGLDYRGEPTPYGYPAVVSQFGITDLCGFEKDNFYYLKSWWTKDVVLHIASNWDYAEGTDSVDVIVYSNCPQVELFVNKESLGIQPIAKNDFATWKVKFVPGTLSAVGYNEKGERLCGEGDGKSYGISVVNGNAKATRLKMLDYGLTENDVAIITVSALNDNNEIDITANNQIQFTIDGDVDMVFVGNGDPSSHETEVFFAENIVSQIVDLKECTVPNLEDREETAEGYNYSSWIPAFSAEPDNRHWDEYKDSLKVIRGTFNIDKFDKNMTVTLFAKSIVEQQTIYVNGHILQENIQRANQLDAIQIPLEYLKSGKNEYVVTGQKFRKTYIYDEPNREPGCVGIVYPTKQTTRELFNGYSQIIVKPKNGQRVKITAESDGLGKAEIVINE